MLSLPKRQRLWDIHDKLMKRLDSVIDESGDIFERTHPWLFDSSIAKPEIIETEETLRLEEKNKIAIGAVADAIAKNWSLLFPEKPEVREQQKLI